MSSRESRQQIKRAAHAPRKTIRPSTESLGGSNETLLTRRRFLYGAAGVGAVAVVGAGAAYVHARSSASNEVVTLEVPKSSLTTLNDMTVIDDYEQRVMLQATYDLPYGTLLWANGDDIAACLLPTNQGSPLTNVGILNLVSGYLATILEKAVGAAEGFEIYDVRACTFGLVWTEANVLDGTWRIYSARLSGLDMGTPTLADEGDDVYETPTLAAVGNYAWWQVLPKLPNTDALPFLLKRCTFGSDKVETVVESPRRMGTPPYALADSLVITPRLDMPNVFYQLTHIDGPTGETLETLTLPQGMKPLEAGYGRTGFSFTFDSIYNYGDGISNLGTYTPFDAKGDYSLRQWFGFARTPSAPPAWAGKLFIVKSSYSVCGVDLDAKEYFAIDVEDGTDSYGEYLASTGMNETFVTFSNIDYKPVNGDAIKACRVKVWRPIAYTPMPESATLQEQPAQNA